MKQAIKLILAGSVLVAGAAQAGIESQFGTGAGTSTTSLVLFVSNSADSSNFYVRDLGFTMDQLLSQSTAAGVANGGNVAAGVNLNIGADSALNSFLSSHASGTNTFTIMGGSGDNEDLNFSLGLNRYIALMNPATSPTGANASTRPTNTQTINDMHDGLRDFFSDVSNALGAATSGVIQDIGFGATGTSGAQAGKYFSVLTNGYDVALGAANLWAAVTSGGANTSRDNMLKFGTLDMDGVGNLTFASSVVSSVPLPAAAWLLGSGLLGLAGVGRRRRAVVAA